MAQIVPTILTENIQEFATQARDFRALSKRLQIDISDGTFAPNVLVSINDISFPPDTQVDLHMMTAKPSQYLARIIELKPSLCILHAEVDDDVAAITQQLRMSGIKVGIALLKGTFPGKVKDMISSADHVMIFAGSLGQQGVGIDLLQTEKVPLIKAINPNTEIGWDGGINLSNVRALAHAGVDVLNIGSALVQATDRPAMYQSLMAECEKKGILI